MLFILVSSPLRGWLHPSGSLAARDITSPACVVSADNKSNTALSSIQQHRAIVRTLTLVM